MKIINFFKSLFKEKVNMESQEYDDLVYGLFTSEPGSKLLNCWISEDLRKPPYIQNTVSQEESLAYAEGRRSRTRNIISIIDRVIERNHRLQSNVQSWSARIINQEKR